MTTVPRSGRLLLLWTTVLLLTGMVTAVAFSPVATGGPSPDEPPVARPRIGHRAPASRAAVATSAPAATAVAPSTSTSTTTAPAAPGTTTAPATTVAPAPALPPPTTARPAAPATTRPPAPPAPAPAPAPPAPAPAPAAPAAPPSLLDQVLSALTTAVPAEWRNAIHAQVRLMPGDSSLSWTNRVIEIGVGHATAGLDVLRSTLAHEFGHLIAYRYGTNEYLGAAPAGWPAYGSRPEEAWADCVSRAFTGIADGSHGLPPCSGAALAWTAGWLAQGPAAHAS